MQQPYAAWRAVSLVVLFIVIAVAVTTALVCTPSPLMSPFTLPADAAFGGAYSEGRGGGGGLDRLAVARDGNRQAGVEAVALLEGDQAPPRTLRAPYEALNLRPPPADAAYQFLIPFVMQGGVPLLAVRVLNQATVFVCVADTGSMELNLSASSCARCDLGYGMYEHAAALDSAPSQLLVYGTQSDFVKEVQDRIQLHEGGESYAMPICVTVERSKSQSNFNVFGLQDARPRRSQATEKGQGDGGGGILSYMMRPSHRLLVRFDAADRTDGVIASVGEAASRRFEQKAVLRVPLTWSEMGFFMTRLEGIRVGDTNIKTSARLVIWDTGSNLTSLPKPTLERCMRGLNARRPITFVLDGRNEFTVDAVNYVWKGSQDIMLDDDLEVLGAQGAGYIIMGAHCMQEHQFLFTSDHLSIAPSSFGPIEVA